MAPWQFWIDVGGTFTDCLGQAPTGEIVRHKVLSSGVVKGVADAGSSTDRIVDRGRAWDPDGIWRGFRLRLLDRDGAVIDESSVTEFSPSDAALKLGPPLHTAPAGRNYELVTDWEAPVLAIRYLLGLAADRPLPTVSVRLGTTRGTNALLTRRGARTAFVTTRGFGDILRVGYQNRPKLFELAIRKPVPLFSTVAEIDERVTHDGQVLATPNPDAIRRQLAELREQGTESLAVCLLNAYCQPDHERLIGRLAREVGFTEVSLSSEVAPLIKLVSRGDTTVMDAYLNPVLRTYVGRLSESLRGPDGAADLRVLTSAGGLVTAERFVGKDSVLSGPAGGVVGFSRVAQACGFERAIGFDMGGTSTDVSRFDGRYELEYETEKAGVRVVVPMMAIETVAAGGGSICRFDGVKLVVGPDSAGASPGPACYGRGGPLAVTDANLYLGRIAAEHFPFPLDRTAVERRLAAIADEVAAASGQRLSPVEIAAGFVRVANANMAKAIRSISIAKGYDPRDYVLVAFGGAAGQHACAVAAELGMERILHHPDAGLLSAYGIGLADVVRHRFAGVYRPYGETQLRELDATFGELSDAARGEVLAEGVPAERIELRRSLDLRFQGLDAFLTIAEPPPSESYADRFRAEYQRLYGYLPERRPIEIVAVRVEAIGRSNTAPRPSQRVETKRTPVARETRGVWFDGREQPTAIFDRADLRPGDVLVGPAIVVERASTAVIDPGWTAEVYSNGELVVIEEFAPLSPPRGEGRGEQVLRFGPMNEPDPIQLEIFNNHFAAIAEQMGITLRNTSTSVNVKERLDFSCAIFTPTGDLVVNAPHIPVHLGAMGETVRCLIADNPDLRPGDVLVTNDPYRGGSHLPDITVVTPVFQDRLLFFTASRAHHAEIGGIVPGSMPPFSRNLAEEGVLIRNFKVVAGGESRMDALRELLLGATYPTRNVGDNLADITAQIAANQQGVRDLLRLVERHGLDTVTAYMGHIQTAAEQKMRAALRRLPPGRRTFTDHLDDGTPITVTLTIAGDTAEIDFTGTGPVVAGNLNANRAIVTAAVMYCLRCLIAEDIPLNQGVLAPVRIVVPECLLNPPDRGSPELCAAVAAGNVETSQRVVDVLLGALGVAAASQGTMNNLLFGDATFGYYETICGGAGATPDAPGADAVHTHMTNTRLTDPEVLERRYPVRLRSFSIRVGSGGAGRNQGGNGVVRQLEFLRELDVSILSQRRGAFRPYGIDGGSPGQVGVNMRVRRDGTRETLPGMLQFRVGPGDVLTIETPGGGGCGE